MPCACWDDDLHHLPPGWHSTAARTFLPLLARTAQHVDAGRTDAGDVTDNLNAFHGRSSAADSNHLLCIGRAELPARYSPFLPVALHDVRSFPGPLSSAYIQYAARLSCRSPVFLLPPHRAAALRLQALTLRTRRKLGRQRGPFLLFATNCRTLRFIAWERGHRRHYPVGWWQFYHVSPDLPLFPSILSRGILLVLSSDPQSLVRRALRCAFPRRT